MVVSKKWVFSFFLATTVLLLSGLALAFPTFDAMILNSTNSTLNDTNQNLTAFFINVTGPTKNITDWQIEQPDTSFSSYALVNTPFEQPDDAILIKDYSTNGNDAVPKNAASFNSTAGHDGFGAYVFDGVNDYLDYTTGFSNFFDPDTEVITTGFWFKPDDVSTTQVMFNEYASSGVGSVEWSFWIWNDGKPRVNLGKAGFVNQWAFGTTTLNVGQWYYITGVFNGTHISIYLDGVLENTTTETASGYTVANNFIVGSRQPLLSPFNGVIDEFETWDRVLSDNQIGLLASNVTDVIHSNETTHGETWRVCGTVVNTTQNGTELCSNSLVINLFPKIDAVNLTSTDPLTNNTFQNLTLKVVNLTDPDNDAIKNITDWRLWNGTDFVSYAVLNMPFEASSNNVFVKDYSTFNKSTSLSANNPSKSLIGHDSFGTYFFDGVNDVIGFGDYSNFENLADLTVSFWAKKSSVSGTGGVIAKWTGGGDESWAFVEENGTFNVWLDTVGGGQNFTSGGVDAWNDTNWHYFAFTYNSSVLKIYKDGSLLTTDSVRHSGLIDQGDDTSFIGFWGNTPTVANAFGGFVDDVLVFDKTLSAEQISLLANDNTMVLLSENTNPNDLWQGLITPSNHFDIGVTVTSNNLSIFDEPPNLFDNKPVNNSIFNVSQTIELSVNATDNVAVDKVFVNVTFPNTTVSTLELFNVLGDKYNNSFTIPALLGNYSLLYFSNDTNNLRSTLNGGFITGADPVPPVIVLNKNTSLLEFEQQSISINWSVTDNLAVDFVLANVTFPDGSLLFSSNNNPGSVILTPSNLTQVGIYTVQVFSNDTNDNQANTSTTFTVQDTTPPGTVTNLQNISSGLTSILWSWTNPADSDFNGTLLFLDGTNIVNLSSVITQYNVTGLGTGELHNLSVQTIDLRQNINTALVIDEGGTLIDNTPPTFLNLANQTTEKGLAFSYDINATDTSGVDKFSLTDLSSQFVINPSNGIVTDNVTLSTLGVFEMTVFVNDTLGNLNQQNFTVTVVDTTPPGVVTGLADTNVTNSSVTWNWTNPIDSDFSHVEVTLDGVFQFNTTNQSHVFSGLAGGTTFTIGVTSVDVSGNKASQVTDTATTLTTSAAGTTVTTGSIVSIAVVLALIALMFLMAWLTFQYADGSPLKIGFWILTFIHYLVLLWIGYNLAIDSSLPSSITTPLLALFTSMGGVFLFIIIFVFVKMTKESISSKQEDDLWKK